ncbi:MAG: hypothetical protein M3256_27685 [Actinomycetota bacterium]|nr:hypothetical protein [Actinomycetota bacterium]
MSYIRASDAAVVSLETVELLARLAGFAVPPEDIAPLAAALSDQLASIELLDRMDLTDVNPALEFDPRWE